MKCVKCGLTLIRFLDGYGQRRFYCRKCYISFTEDTVIEFGPQKTLTNFAYSNPKAVASVRRWK